MSNIQRYLVDLEDRLAAEGLDEYQRQAAIDEVSCHLHASLAARLEAGVESDEELVTKSFGGPRQIAEGLAEIWNSSPTRGRRAVVALTCALWAVLAMPWLTGNYTWFFPCLGLSAPVFVLLTWASYRARSVDWCRYLLVSSVMTAVLWLGCAWSWVSIDAPQYHELTPRRYVTQLEERLRWEASDYLHQAEHKVDSQERETLRSLADMQAARARIYAQQPPYDYSANLRRVGRDAVPTAAFISLAVLFANCLGAGLSRLLRFIRWWKRRALRVLAG